MTLARTAHTAHTARTVLAVLAVLTVTACELAVGDAVRYGSVNVQANSRTGVPLPGIDVMLYTGRRPMGYAQTDASGLVTFKQVPPGNYGVTMQLPASYADLSEFSAVPNGTVRDGISIFPGRDTVISFTFVRRGLGSIETLLRDSAGVGIAGLRVDFYQSTGVVGSVLSNAAGIARLDGLPTGQYGTALQPPDSLGVLGAPFLFRDGLLVDRDSVPRAIFTLAVCRGTISVTVRDQANAAIVGIGVMRYGATGPSRLGTTDASGNVLFGNVLCGEHGVALQSLAGFSFNFVRDSGYVDGLNITNGAALSATLRATRN